MVVDQELAIEGLEGVVVGDQEAQLGGRGREWVCEGGSGRGAERHGVDFAAEGGINLKIDFVANGRSDGHQAGFFGAGRAGTGCSAAGRAGVGGSTAGYSMRGWKTPLRVVTN